MLALSLYSTLHLGTAMVVAFMAVIHLGMWWALRTERANLWVGLSFAGYAILDAALAGSSIAGRGELGPVAPWLAITVVTALLLPFVLTHTIWAVLDLPVGRIRRALGWAAIVLVLPEVLNVIRLIATGHPSAASWEASRYDFFWVAIPYQIALVGVGLVWVVEAARCLSSVPTIARLALLPIAPALAINVREAMLSVGLIGGPTWIGLTGLPLAVFASGALVVRHVRMVRDAAQPHDVDERYRRVFQLGRGGMGEVWLGVRHGAGGFRRFVVLKRIRLDGQSDEAMARFVAEARVAARLHHPNIVAVYDFGRFDAGGDASGWFIVMEYLAGASLYDVLRRAYQEQVAVPPEVILAVGIGVLRGLECAHGHGVLHRDVSPDNVIITFEGAVKLLDFGIAKDTLAATEAPNDDGPLAAGGFMTVPGGVAGKRRYLAPERVVGDSASAESDLYSLALVMLELFGCQLPDTGADVAGTPTPLSDAGLGPPEGLDDVLSRALSSHPKRRFRSAGAMAAALRRVATTLPAVELGPWVRELCPSRYEIARRLGKLETPDADAVEAVFRDIALPTVEVSPPQPGARPGAVEALVDRLVAVGPKIDVRPQPAVQTPRTEIQPPKPTRTPSRTIPD